MFKRNMLGILAVVLSVLAVVPTRDPTCLASFNISGPEKKNGTQKMRTAKCLVFKKKIVCFILSRPTKVRNSSNNQPSLLISGFCPSTNLIFQFRRKRYTLEFQLTRTTQLQLKLMNMKKVVWETLFAPSKCNHQLSIILYKTEFGSKNNVGT